MIETMALVRFSIRRHTRFLTILGLMVGTGVLMAFVAPKIIPGSLGDNIGIFGLVMGLGWSALLSIALFDYGGFANLAEGESGCNRWVLGMPIKSWKIAIVPIALRTFWIAGLCVIALLVFKITGILNSNPNPAPHSLRSLLLGCICVAALSTWGIAIGWRPFSNGWWRLAALGVLGLLAYSALILVLATAESGPFRHLTGWKAQMRASLPAALTIGVIVLYVSGVWFSIRAIKLAKVESHGLVPEAGKMVREAAQAANAKRLEHKTARRALVWYYLAKARPWIRRALVIMAPGLLMAILFVPLHVVSAIAVFAWTLYTGAIGVTQGEGNHGQKPRYKTNMESFLASSPLPTATIAWTRLATHLGTLAGCMSMGLVVFVGWMIWPENRATWWQWASEQAVASNAPEQTLAIGLRWSLAIVIGVNAFLLFRWATFIWVGYSGRESWTVVFSVCWGVLLLGLLGIVLGWFLTNATSWDNVRESFWHWMEFLPHLCATLLVIKLICSTLATAFLIKWDLVADAGVVKALLLWLLVAGGLGVGMWALIPDPRATLAWCLTGSVLAIPLARIMVLPVMLQLNRVR